MSKRAWRNGVRILLSVVLGSAVLVAGGGGTVSADASWQITVTRTGTSPELTGNDVGFTIQLQCAAVDEQICRDSEVRFPAQAPTTFRQAGTQHPLVEGFALDGTDWVFDLADIIQAGTSFSLTLNAQVPNFTTPDGTTFTVDATVDGSNTAPASASDDGAWSASSDLLVQKFLGSGPGTDAVVDQTTRFYFYICDPTFDPLNPAGHLDLTDVQIVDTLPAGVNFVAASQGGIFDAGTNTITIDVPGNVLNRTCSITGSSPYFVDVEYPSGTFGPGLVEMATNNVDVTGTPIGAPPGNEVMSSSALTHGFGVPTPVGDINKVGRTPFFGFNTPDTYDGEGATYAVSLVGNATSSQLYQPIVFDSLPCLDNDTGGATPIYTSNAVTNNSNPAAPFDTTPCANPAFQPDTSIRVDMSTVNGGIQLLSLSTSDFAASVPNLPVNFVSTLGNTGSVDLPLIFAGGNNIGWQIAWDDFTAAAGFGAGEGLSAVWVDFTDLNGVAVGVIPGSDRQYFLLSLNGSVVADSPASLMPPGTIVRNNASLALVTPETTGELVSYAPNQAEGDVNIVEQLPVIRADKSEIFQDGKTLWRMQANFETLFFQPGEQVIMTDLLPVGQVVDTTRPFDFNYTLGAVSDPSNFIGLEIIDDYNSTGRTLVRATIEEPPQGWGEAGNGSVLVSIPSTGPQPSPVSVTNDMQVFPTDPITASSYQCRATRNAPLSAPEPATADIDNLDGSAPADLFPFCTASETVDATPGVFNIESQKLVRATNPGFQGFPTVELADSTGGTAEFRIQMSNVGAASLDDLVIYDVLPFVGDTGLSESQVATDRESDFQATFAGFTNLPTGIDVEYSVETNPCRDELTTGASPFPTGCVAGSFSATAPAALGDVRSLRFTATAAGTFDTFDAGEEIVIDYEATYPTGVQPGEIAWNSFAYAGTNGGTAILPSEPPKVGFGIPEVDLSVDKTSSVPGPLTPGQAYPYTITITNDAVLEADGTWTGSPFAATSVELVDDLGGAGGLEIVPGSSAIINTGSGQADGATFNEATGAIAIPEVGPLDEYVLTYDATRSTVGTVTNSVQVTALDQTDSDSIPGNDVPAEDDQDDHTSAWVLPSLSLQKQVESARDSGNYIEADASDSLTGSYLEREPIRYRFVVTNGPIPMTDVTLADDLAGFSCDQTIGALAANEVRTIDCDWAFGYPDIQSYVNTGTVTGTPTVGDQTPLTDTDTAEVVISTRLIDLSLDKTVDADNDGTYSASETATEGVAFTYRIVATNAVDAADATGVVVTEAPPAGVSITGGTITAGATASGGSFDVGTLLWTVGDLPAGESVTLIVEAVINDADVFNAGTRENEVEVTAAGESDLDSTPGNDEPVEDDLANAIVAAQVAPPTTAPPTTAAPDPTVPVAPETTTTTVAPGPTTAPTTAVPPGNLPQTGGGGSSPTTILFAVLLLVAGTALTIGSTRRRRAA